jgi:hypothetical protein
MLPAVAKFVGGKVITAVLVVSSTLIVIWYFRLPLEERAALWSMARSALIWIGFVAVLPWATFFVPARVVRAESNAMAAAMLAFYLLADVGFAMYLTRGTFGGTWQTAVLLLGFLVAGLYNFLACDFVANRVEDSA